MIRPQLVGSIAEYADRVLASVKQEEHAWADREASGVAAAVDEKDRIDGELEAMAKQACSLGGDGLAHVALQAASLLAAKLSYYHGLQMRAGGRPCAARGRRRGVGSSTASGRAASAALFALRDGTMTALVVFDR